MTTTDAIAGLRRQLDAEPENAGLRSIYADALEESGNPEWMAMADGYRALWKTASSPLAGQGTWTWFGSFDVLGPGRDDITDSWLLQLRGGSTDPSPFIGPNWRDYPTLAEAEDAAAEAFGRLPGAEKRRILEWIE